MPLSQARSTDRVSRLRPLPLYPVLALALALVYPNAGDHMRVMTSGCPTTRLMLPYA